MYRKIVYFFIASVFFFFLHTFFSGCRLVDGQDPGLESSDSSLSLNNLVIEAQCASEIFVGENFSCQPSVIINSQEIAANQLTWELSQLNTCHWVNINTANGNLFGAASSAQIGNCLLAFRVKTETSAGASNSQDPNVEVLDQRSEFSFSVSVKPPKVIVDYKNCSGVVGIEESFQCDLMASNGIPGSAFNYELASANECAWVIVDSKTGHFRGAPSSNHIGTCKLVAQARDIFGSVGSKEIMITVPAVKVTITPTSCPTTIKANSAYSCELLGSVNLPEKTLVWSLSNDNTCSWASINTNTGLVTGMPSVQNSNSTCSLSVRATSANGVAQGAYLASVVVPKVNFSISENNCVANLNVNTSSVCSLKATVDIQNPQIVWSKENTNTCNFVSVNSATGEFTLTPGINDVGICSLSVAATLGGVIKMKWSKNITVAAVPISVNLDNCVSSLPAENSYNCFASASSSVAGASYLWSFSAANTCSWLSIDSATGRLSGTPNIGATGNCTLAVSAKLGNASEGVLGKTIVVTIRKYIANTLSEIPIASNSAAGTSVSVDGSYVAVGVPGFIQGDGSTGRVLVYFRESGQSILTLKQIINPPETKIKNFGYSVSIKGSVLAIGAPMATQTMTNQGALSIYEKSGSSWIQGAVIWGTSTAPNGYFGASVSTDGNKVLAATGHYLQPAAYWVAKNPNWSVIQSLDFSAISTSAGADRIKVALNGNQAVISDKLSGTTRNGEVHIFDFVNTSFVKKEVPLAGGTGEGYGSSIAFFKNWIVVGAPQANLGAGKVYLYEKDGSTNYNLRTVISSSYFKNNDNCGMSVAIYENVYDRILIGCPTNGNSDSGSVYAFFLNVSDGTFAVTSKIVPTNGKVNDQFGSSVAGSSGLIAIGARLYDLSTNTDSGNVFSFIEGP